MTATSRIGIALISCCVLLLELTLTRLFSATMFYHFAFMAISLALFGSAAGSVFVFLFQKRLTTDDGREALARFALGIAGAAVLTLYVVLTLPLDPAKGLENYYRLVVIYCTASLPFFFAGGLISLLFRTQSSDASRIYFFDLAGAACGCALLIPLLNRIGAINTVFLVAALSAVAAAVFAQQRTRGFALTVAMALLVLVGVNSSTNRLTLRHFKGLSSEGMLFSKWNSFSYITVHGKPSDPSLTIQIDADAATSIVKSGVPQGRRVEDMPYLLRGRGSVLIVGPGGGKEVLLAQSADAEKITAVEVNPIIANDVMSHEPFRSYSGALYERPRTTLVVDEARSFIRRSHEQYDLIQANMVDTWAATAAGAFALTENNLYTVEAFEDYARHLAPGGLLSITRWYSTPPDQMLRLVGMARTMMDELHLPDPAGSLILIKGRVEQGRPPAATFLFRRGAFTRDEVKMIEMVAKHDHYEILYSPLTRPPNVFTELITAADPHEIWQRSQSNIEPTRDNNPFFFNSLRLSDSLYAFSGDPEWRKTNLGTLVLMTLLVLSSILVVLFILLPLRFSAVASGEGRGAIARVLYFAAIGAGFIVIEVALIQKFILFLGHPVYALTIVLFSLLLFSGIGSFFTARFSDELIEQRGRMILASIALGAVVYVLLLAPLFYALVQLPIFWRASISIALLAPISMAMGMPMPLGLRLLSRQHRELIPWAWGVNGAASVTGSIFTLALALATGFNQALMVGATFYLLAFLLLPKVAKEWTVEREVALAV